MGFEGSTTGSRNTASEIERGTTWCRTSLVTLPTPTTAQRRQVAIFVLEVVCRKRI